MDNVLVKSMFIDGEQYYIYGVTAYIFRPWLQKAFNRRLDTPSQHFMNTTMSAVRTCVQRSYKDKKQMWS